MPRCKAEEEAHRQSKAERGGARDGERLPEPLPETCEDTRLALPANVIRRARLLLARQRGQGNASVQRARIVPRDRAHLRRADGEGEPAALPEVPRLELPMPSLLRPQPEPFAHIRLEVPPLILRAVEEQLNPDNVRRALLQLSLGGPTAPAPSGAVPTPGEAVPPAAQVPAGPGPAEPRAATPGDLLRALAAVPAVEAALNRMRDLALARLRSDWRRLSTGERAALVGTAALVAGGALAGVLSQPGSRATALQQLAGRSLPVPGVPGFRVQLNLRGENWLVGFHLDLGALLPPGLGFGPSSPVPISPAPALQRDSDLPAPDRLPEEVVQELEREMGHGRPLEPQVAAELSECLGADFRDVRIHTGSEAERLNRKVSARAFTVGRDIFFGEGSYRPGTPEGERLLLHELVHVLQQGGKAGRLAELEVSSPDDPSEREAESFARDLEEGGAREPTAVGATAGLSRVVARMGPYAPGTYGELISIARLLAIGLREQLDEVPATETVYREAMDWINGVEGWQRLLRGREAEEISEAAAAQAQLWWDELQRLRTAIQRYKQDRIIRELRAAQGAVAGAAASLEEHRGELDEAMRAAFLRNDEEAIAQVSNFVGNALDIGLGLQELSRDIASAIADARGATIPEASRYTRWLGKINRVLAAANLLYSLIQESPPTQLSTALGQVNTLAGAFSAGTTLLGLAPHIGLYANLYLVPAVQVITSNLDRILGKHLHQLNIVASATGFPVDMSNEPGGWPLFYFMFDVMHASGPEGVPYPVPAEVERFLLSRREVISAGARPEEGQRAEMPTTGWWFWRRLDRAQIQQWVFQNRRSLWAMFYGSMPLPRAEQIRRRRG